MSTQCDWGVSATAAGAAATLIGRLLLPSTLPAQEIRDLTAGAVEALADSAFEVAGEAGGAAVIAVVKDGEVLLTKGYGYANPLTKRPVDPSATLFRIGSVTKVFTAIVALQLIDEGVIDPESDVNTYLANVGVHLEDRFDDAVTMADLLRLRAGRFDWTYDYLYPVTDDANSDVPRDEIGRRWWRTRPPGGVSAYDNNGVGLIGYVGAAAVRTPYRDLVRDRILEPLGMTHSVAGVPRERVRDMVGCHDDDPQTAYQSCPYSLIVVPLRPSGGMTVTGRDMGYFMLALLGEGRLGASEILSPSAFDQFTDFQTNKVDPRLPAFGRLIYESYRAGRYAYGHDGGVGRFAASMRLYPDHETGLFVSVQTGPDWVNRVASPHSLRGLLGMPPAQPPTPAQRRLAGARVAFEEKFATQFIAPMPVSDAEMALPDIDPIPLSAVAGRYWGQLGKGKRPLTLRVLERLEPVTTVSAQGDDRIRIRTASESERDGDIYRWAGPNRYETEDGTREIVFAASPDGVVANWVDGAAPWFLQRLPWHYRPWATIFPLLLGLAYLASASVYWYVRRTRPPARRLALLATIGATLVAAGLWFELDLVITHLYHNGSTGLAASWRSLLHLGLVGLIAVPLMLVVKWRLLLESVKGRAQWIEGGYLALLGASSVVVVILCAYWGVVGNFVG